MEPFRRRSQDAFVPSDEEPVRALTAIFQMMMSERYGTLGQAEARSGYALPAFPAPAAPSRIPTPSDHLNPTAAVAVFCSALRHGRLQVRKRPSSGDHPRVEILSACPEHGNDAAEPVPVELLARNRQSSDPPRKGTGRALATGPAPACGHAALPTLRSIHSVEAEPLAADLECVAVERASRTADHPLRGGGRLASGRERTATSRTSPTGTGRSCPAPRRCSPGTKRIARAKRRSGTLSGGCSRTWRRWPELGWANGKSSTKETSSAASATCSSDTPATR